MAIQLVTDQLSTVVDDKLRSQLVGNFKVIEKALNDLDAESGNINYEKIVAEQVKKLLDDEKSDLRKAIVGSTQQLTDRINRIVLGTDHESIRAVVEDMAQDENLRGEPGQPGEVGKSAYQVWLDSGHVGSEDDFFAAMKGSKGDTGSTGAAGKDGAMSSADVQAIVDQNLQYHDIAKGTDLFTLINNTGKTQYYYCRTNEAAKTMLNAPVHTAFNLIVRPVSTPTKTVGTDGNPTYSYTTLELHPYNSSQLFIASITTNSTGTLSSTPWASLSDASSQ